MLGQKKISSKINSLLFESMGLDCTTIFVTFRENFPKVVFFDKIKAQKIGFNEGLF